jgi:putative prophage lp2 protein 26
MNRQIKFRGFTTHFDKGWVYGLLSVKNTIDEMTNFGWVSETIVEESSIGQFTGFRDRNDVDIYEGDVVEEYLFGFPIFSVIEWNDENGCFGKRQIRIVDDTEEEKRNGMFTDIHKWNCKNSMVIGNIFENNYKEKIKCSQQSL